MRLLPSLPVLLALLQFACTVATAATVPLSGTVRCVSDPQCIFTGSQLRVEFVIKNTADEDVFLNTKYMNSGGPDITFTHARTKESAATFGGLSDNEYLGDFQIIPPQGEATLPILIDADEILRLGRPPFKVNVEVTYSGRWKFEDSLDAQWRAIAHFQVTATESMAPRAPRKNRK
jgi:hypothetical protein